MSTRRTFITLLGGAAAAWPLAARAQQPQRVRRIGVLTHLGSDDPDLPPRASAFSRGLQELGWFDGRNARIEYRFGAGNTDRRWLGSTTFANTIGIALVASSSGRMVENPLVKITSGPSVTISAARPRMRAVSPAAQRVSILRVAMLKQIAPSVTRAAVLRSEESPLRGRSQRCRWSEGRGP